VLFKEVNAATVKVLNAEGISVIVPKEQGCCGALAGHAGQRTAAQHSARAVIETFDLVGVDAVITNSAGCGAMMKDYAELLGHDQEAEKFSSRVADVLEYLDRMESIADYKSMPGQVLYHEPCHLKFAQAVGSAPSSVIRRIPDIDLQSVGGPNCCGAGGLYSLAQPELARQVGEAKRDAILDAGAGLLLSGNPGCAIQLQTLLGPRVEVVHPIVLLARALDHE
jgi:glycolate oxidase iron-sulfur subunit